jgi:hypothetical protein
VAVFVVRSLAVVSMNGKPFGFSFLSLFEFKFETIPTYNPTYRPSYDFR